jgi:tetratricopeptide (TPR) repeat protein
MIDTAAQRINTLEKRVGLDAKSPLFAQLAYYYLEASRAEDALRICDAGLANFPFYTTGHLIKGKALVALNMRTEARREFEFVYDFLPNNATIKTLLEQIPPSAEETFTAAPETAEVEVAEPESFRPEPVQIPTKEYTYTTPAPPPKPIQPTTADYGFGTSEPSAPEPQPEPVFAPTPSAGTSFFDTITQSPTIAPLEQSFNYGFEAPSVGLPSTPEPTPFADFSFPQPEPTTFEETPATSVPSSGVFEFNLPNPDVGFSTSSAPSEEESFDHYASRRRAELAGENTVSLDAYLSSQQAAAPLESINSEEPILPPPITPFSFGVQDKIEELANTLQNVGRITPEPTPLPPPTPVINFAQKETATATEQDTPAGMGFVTPTLAEIYAKQGWFDDAIKAYKTLARNKPADKERFEKRITELEQLKNKNG